MEWLIAAVCLIAFLALGWVLTLDSAITRSRRDTRQMRRAYQATRMHRNSTGVRW